MFYTHDLFDQLRGAAVFSQILKLIYDLATIN